MMPCARYVGARMWFVVPLLAVGLAYWTYWHLLSGQRSTAAAIIWRLLSISILWHLALAWADRPARVTPRQQRALNNLFVTVNVPIYNEDPSTIRLVLCSLFAQDRLPDRIHVVDDGSSLDYRHIIAEFKAMARFYPQVRCSWTRTVNRGKRHAQALTFSDSGQADIFVTLDSDTVLDKAAIREGLKPFADPRVTSVAATMITYNADRNVITRLTELWFTVFQTFLRAAWSRLGCVLVNSGCLAFYRANVIRDALPAYVSEKFLGKPVQFSDDSLLTLYALLSGRTVQQSTCFAFMVMPDRLSHHFRQQIRWMRGSFIRSWWRFRYLPLSRIAYWEHLIMWVTFAIAMMMFTDVFVEAPLFDHRPPAAGATALSLILVYAAASRFLLIRRNDQRLSRQLATFCLTPLTGLWTAVVLRPLRLYAIATCRKTGWGTRSSVEVGITRRGRCEV